MFCLVYAFQQFNNNNNDNQCDYLVQLIAQPQDIKENRCYIHQREGRTYSSM